MDINLSLWDLIIIAVTLIAAFLIIKLVSHFLRKTGERLEIDLTAIQILQEIIKYTIYILALTIILGKLGLNLTTIAVSFGIVGVTVGFAARDIISNFISGLFIFIDKSFKVGDIIEMSNNKGKVIKLSFRTTTMITPDEKIITIPNSSFSKTPYINHTGSEVRRVDLDIIIPYELELEKVIKSLEKAAKRCEWVLNDRKPRVLIKELSDVGIKATLTTWGDDPWKVALYRSSLAKEANKILEYKNA
ncbi:MAG: mechanosensitive ion channel family protein [Euryarchaeota archaeon]|nr:mechanosensitive ion channel family protein [Euryarchaeota archaeon]